MNKTKRQSSIDRRNHEHHCGWEENEEFRRAAVTPQDAHTTDEQNDMDAYFLRQILSNG